MYATHGVSCLGDVLNTHLKIRTCVLSLQGYIFLLDAVTLKLNRLEYYYGSETSFLTFRKTWNDLEMLVH